MGSRKRPLVRLRAWSVRYNEPNAQVLALEPIGRAFVTSVWERARLIQVRRPGLLGWSQMLWPQDNRAKLTGVVLAALLVEFGVCRFVL